uniref:Transmembrane protein 17B n=1 Tax=Steinernema glaseri TaxID=37863 RepID=A0A1I7XX16_9BILA
MALHFNVYFTPFWAISHIACYVIKYSHLSLTYQVILTPVHFLYTIIEIVRLYLGYYGNLSEKISALSGFWISSLILQIPTSIFLLSNEEIIPLPLERFVYSVHLLFLLIQVFSGFFMIKTLADSQVAKFKQRALEEEVDREDQDETKKTM